MSFMFWLHDMGKCIWFKQFEREDTVEQATQFEYTHSVEFSAEIMDELEHFLFWYFYYYFNIIISPFIFILCLGQTSNPSRVE